MTVRLKEWYQKKGIPELREALHLKNVHEVPRLVKIVVNMGVGTDVDRDALKAAAEDLGRITGQRPVINKARQSISNFKLREGMPIGCKVTLRGNRMYEFLDRLISATLPRIRDFRGISPKSFDGRGGYSLGLPEQSLFPEINPDQVKTVQGMDITLVTTAKTNDAARELLSRLGMPFAK
ncbi:MAG: 50S ribosomal protein L5 [Kiritimatiellia bacterium]|nr:50S ribosomal protein L5 [Kiritimatiellia bacterium]